MHLEARRRLAGTLTGLLETMRHFQGAWEEDFDCLQSALHHDIRDLDLVNKGSEVCHLGIQLVQLVGLLNELISLLLECCMSIWSNWFSMVSAGMLDTDSSKTT